MKATRYALTLAAVVTLPLACGSPTNQPDPNASIDAVADASPAEDASRNATTSAPEAGNDGGSGTKDAALERDAHGDADTAPPDSSVPGAVALSDLVASDLSTCAIFVDGRIKCWGYNANGELGYPDRLPRGTTPASMAALGYVDLGTGVRASTASIGWGVPGYSCVTTPSGAGKCWRFSASGPLERGDDVPFLPYSGLTAVEVKDSTKLVYGFLDGSMFVRGYQGSQTGNPSYSLGAKVKKLRLGNYTNCALLDGGIVKCVGRQDGSGGAPQGPNLTPLDLGPGRTAIDIALGYQHTCVLLDVGTVHCWGWTSNGNLGYGVLGQFSEPATNGPPSQTPALTFGAANPKIAEIASRGWFSCARTVAGEVFCWGASGGGGTGLGTTVDVAVPTRVDLGTGRTAKRITVGLGHACAYLDNDVVKCWGDNGYGQLGLGDVVSRGTRPGQMGDALPPVLLSR